MANKIKSLSVKNGNEYPIGSDARLIDTFQKLDLESLIKLGGSYYITTKQTNTGEITEQFFCQDKNHIEITYTDQSQTTIDNVTPYQPYYRLETTFNTLQDINIGALSNDEAIVVGDGDPHTDSLQDTYLVDRTEVETTYEHIIKRLYYKINSSLDEDFIARKDIYKIPKDNNLYEIVEQVSFEE